MKRILAGLLVASMLVGCNTMPFSKDKHGEVLENGNRVNVKDTQWEMTIPRQFSDQEQLKDGLTRIVVFRMKDDLPASTAANIYVNQDYKASLLSNAYTTAVTCAGDNRIESSVQDVKQHYNDKYAINGATFKSQAGETRYYQVTVKADGQSTLTEVDPNDARQTLASFPRQFHTIPRMRDLSCNPTLAL